MNVSFDTNILVYATARVPAGKTGRARDLIARGMRSGRAFRMRARNRRSAILAGVALAALAISAASLTHPILPPANAQDAAAGQAELQKAIASLRPRTSLDTNPVEFSVGGIHYRVPRNYLTTMIIGTAVRRALSRSRSIFRI